jgi:hypothetical protein
MSEIKIWEHVLKWGLAQNPDLPSDLKDYSEDDFINLKNTLQVFIPSIDFYDLTSKEFSEKVLPYEKMFPKDLYNDLLKAFLNLSPHSKPKKTVDSKIISYQHVELISKWINRLEFTDELSSSYQSYEFKLLFRGSRDGLTKKDFHRICDNNSRTVTIVKVKDSNEILGGYNPLEWKSKGGYGTTEDSFIFSFNDNKGRIKNYILSRVINEKKAKAIYNGYSYGPSFGASDLILWSLLSDNNSCNKSSYENPIRRTTDKFNVDECEVFRIVTEKI